MNDNKPTAYEPGVLTKLWATLTLLSMPAGLYLGFTALKALVQAGDRITSPDFLTTVPAPLALNVLLFVAIGLNQVVFKHFFAFELGRGIEVRRRESRQA